MRRGDIASYPGHVLGMRLGETVRPRGEGGKWSGRIFHAWLQGFFK